MTNDTHASARRVFLPGKTTSGHHQIELSCESCHTPFQGVSDAACVACHGDELTAVDDSHPKSKFTDPRNAELVTRLDARSCIACHREHTPDMTRPMGVTQPDDYCRICHEDIGTERPSHQGMAFDTCASAGCHNYHDNTALYEDFLVAHAGEPSLLAQPLLPQLTHAPLPQSGRTAPFTRADHDAPQEQSLTPAELTAWEEDAHARSGVNCSSCHAGGDGWTAKPGLSACAACHSSQGDGFLAGKHGMRIAAGLAPMRPALARAPMHADAAERALGCNSCHPAHGFDTRRAAVEACLTCHDDTHSRAYTKSPHYATWMQEIAGTGAPGSGVSCATCHLPRQTHRAGGRAIVFVQHNQNRNLQPSEKMVRSVCLTCHGLAFSLDSLADRRLVAANFTGAPSRHISSIDMATRRLQHTSNTEASSRGATR